jgi:signal transduction histidine kinase
MKSPNIGIAILSNGKIEKKNSEFSLKNYQHYLTQQTDFFILPHNRDDDYINALYIETIGHKTVMVLRKNIDNKIEDFQDTLLSLIPVLLVVFIFLASKTVDKILIPINKLSNATKDINITKFTKSIEIPKENDEISELVISFNEMIERLKEGVTQLDRFNADVSHELKTPLTVIQGEVEITLRKTREPEVYERTLKTIHKQSKQIEQIVKQLLLLTKYSQDNVKDSFELCSIDTLMMSAIDSFERQLHEKNLKLHIDKIEPISLEVNPILMESIFLNLIDNAIKYTPKNRNITLSLFKDSSINFIIKDEGIGIEEEHLLKITDRFYRADSSRNKKIDGFGLGLSIVLNAVELHGGEMRITSKENKGLEVRVML